MKNKNINMLILALLLIGMMATVLIFFLMKAHENFPKNITVRENGVTEKTLKIPDLKLNPTESKQYEVGVVCDATGAYRISLVHQATKDGGMAPFVNVEIALGKNVLYRGGLAALLEDGMQVAFDGELHESEPLMLAVRYEMPYETGNEAQGTFMDLEIHLTIEKI